MKRSLHRRTANYEELGPQQGEEGDTEGRGQQLQWEIGCIQRNKLLTKKFIILRVIGAHFLLSGTCERMSEHLHSSQTQTARFLGSHVCQNLDTLIKK